MKSQSKFLHQKSLFGRISPLWFIAVFLAGCLLVSGSVLIIKTSRSARQETKYLIHRWDIAISTLVTYNLEQSDVHPLQLVPRKQATGPLRVDPANPRYFTDGSGKAILLTGSHTWNNFMDSGNTDSPPLFDYKAYLDFLVANNHNFFRLWRAENAKGGERGDDWWFNPMPYQRTGPGTALDGKPKFDLNKFNQAYFDRMRERIIEAGQRGIYVSIMLFDGWSISSKYKTHNPWAGHPFNVNNNINGIKGDLNGDGQGDETHTLENKDVTAYQKAYVAKVIDTVNDLDNVLYEISNESPPVSKEWQYEMIKFIKSYEAAKPKQHPVGMTSLSSGDNSVLFASNADWISPAGDLYNPAASDGTKVILNDTDHICGICGDRQWVWESFTRGLNPIFMDPYDGKATGRGAPPGYDPNNQNDVSTRKNMGYVLDYANRINLVAMQPRVDLCSTGYCLANPVADGTEYLVYLPMGNKIRNILDKVGVTMKPEIYLPSDSSVSVDLSATFKNLKVEWFSPEQGTVMEGGVVKGGSIQSFTAPFGGDAVLYIYDSNINLPTPASSPTNQ